MLVVAGGGLLIAHPLVVGIWPWSLAPFNLRFLGALYTAGGLPPVLVRKVGAGPDSDDDDLRLYAGGDGLLLPTP